MSYEFLNLEAMASLYRQAQHAPKYLYATYGIRNLARYYDEKNGTSVLEPQISPDYIPNEDVVWTDVEDESMDFMNPKPNESAKSIGMHNPTYMEARFEKKA